MGVCLLLNIVFIKVLSHYLLYLLNYKLTDYFPLFKMGLIPLKNFILVHI